ncbi:MAG TPA: hypothetical protein VL371_12005 [Gemmataceae bacterium]|nr:hypothetical protein [Gemmataceae bacterium]
MMSSIRPLARVTLTLAAVLLLTPMLPAQRVVPPPPPEYDVQARYSIRAATNQRIVQFMEMTRYLESIDFKREPGEEDEPADLFADRLRGRLPSNKVEDFLRESHVRTVLLIPAGLKLPDNAQQPVLVQIGLRKIAPSRQQELAAQTRDLLAAKLGFVPKVGFDHQSKTRLLGTIPAGRVTDLLKDLRGQPAGPLAPETPVTELPEPIHSVVPVRTAEVLAETEGVLPSVDVPPPPEPEGPLQKMPPDLREKITGEADAAAQRPTRLEAILTNAPPALDQSWRGAMLTVPGVMVEGRIGPVVSIAAPLAVARNLAASPDVASVRLPRAATVQPTPPLAGQPIDVLAATGLARLHAMKYRGAGVRVAVIGSDFTGWQSHVGKELPKSATLIDLTATRNYTLEPDAGPESAEAGPPGSGTRAALAVRFAAPEADLALIRVDPSAAYMVTDVARYVHGETFRTEGMIARNRELRADNDRLRNLRAQITEERQASLNDFSQEEEAVKRRQELAAKETDLAAQERLFAERLRRFFKLEDDLLGLRNVRAVVCPLAWDTGYPVDGTGPLARYFDEIFFGQPQPRILGKPRTPQISTVWLQGAGDTRGQVWTGRFHDADGNGVMEFAPPGMPVPVGRWTTELNFLAWQPHNHERVAELPAGAHVRVALQWTEAHDPDVTPGPDGADPYRAPIADLRPLVLRQRDTSGKRVASDDLNVVARSVRLPQLLNRSATAATYEHIVEFAVDAAGGYALRVEGMMPRSTRPLFAPTLPSQEKAWELTARVFVETTDAASRGQGRPMFADFAPGLGGLGTPGDAALVRTVGAADNDGNPRPYSVYGAPAGRELLSKPSFLAFDQLPIAATSGGTAQSAAFSAGLLASMMSAGVPDSPDLRWLGLSRGDLLRVPPTWLETLPGRKKN